MISTFFKGRDGFRKLRYSTANKKAAGIPAAFFTNWMDA
jgi:hypothetical protein